MFHSRLSIIHLSAVSQAPPAASADVDAVIRRDHSHPITADADADADAWSRGARPMQNRRNDRWRVGP